MEQQSFAQKPREDFLKRREKKDPQKEKNMQMLMSILNEDEAKNQTETKNKNEEVKAMILSYDFSVSFADFAFKKLFTNYVANNHEENKDEKISGIKFGKFTKKIIDILETEDKNGFLAVDAFTSSATQIFQKRFLENRGTIKNENFYEACETLVDAFFYLKNVNEEENKNELEIIKEMTKEIYNNAVPRQKEYAHKSGDYDPVKKHLIAAIANDEENSNLNSGILPKDLINIIADYTVRETMNNILEVQTPNPSPQIANNNSASRLKDDLLKINL